MNYNSDIPIATDGNQLQRRLLSMGIAVFMDKVIKSWGVSTKRVVLWTRYENTMWGVS